MSRVYVLFVLASTAHWTLAERSDGEIHEHSAHVTLQRHIQHHASLANVSDMEEGDAVSVATAPEQTIKVETASLQPLIEELLTYKTLSRDVPLTPLSSGGKIRSGTLSIELKVSKVGDATRLTMSGNKVSLKLKDVNLALSAKYNLRLIAGIKETGSVEGRMYGGDMTFNFPRKGAGKGSCVFSEGIDLDISDAKSDSSLVNPFIGSVMSKDILNFRTEVVRTMQDGLCRLLLEKREGDATEVAMSPGGSATSAVLIILFIIILIAGGCTGMYCLGLKHGKQAGNTPVGAEQSGSSFSPQQTSSMGAFNGPSHPANQTPGFSSIGMQPPTLPTQGGNRF